MAVDLEKTVEKARRGLKKIQRSNEKTKKRYLVLFSSIAMIVVVGLWFFYLSLTLPQPVAGEAGEVRVEAAEAEEGGGNAFFKTIGRGAKNIFGDLKNQFVKFKVNINQVKEFTLEGGGVNFAPSEEPLPPAPLP